MHAEDTTECDVTAHSGIIQAGVVSEFKGAGEGIVRLEYRVKGLDCPNCAEALVEDLKKVSGVASAEVLLASGVARLEADNDRILPEVARIIRGHGLELETMDPVHGGTVARQNLVAALRNIFIFGVGGLFLCVILLERLGVLEGVSRRVPPALLALLTLVVGYPVFRNAWLGVVRWRANSDLLMTIAAGAAASLGEWGATFLIVCFVSVAHLLEAYTLSRAKGAIKELTHLMPDRARKISATGIAEMVPLSAINPGDKIQVFAGELVAADGIVVEGVSAVNESAVTGEPMPVEKAPGDRVYSGSTNGNGALILEVTAVGSESTVGKISRLIQEAEARKSPVERFADRYSSIYLPVVVAVSLLTYFVSHNPRNAIAVLVVACPCAIALATPVSVIAALANAARRGTLLKGGQALETLATATTLVLDKTGTLTLGEPVISDVVSAEGVPESDWLPIVAGLEAQSEHIIARAVRRWAKHQRISPERLTDVTTLPGRGIKGYQNGEWVFLGNRRMLTEILGDPGDSRLMEAARRLEDDGKTVFFCFTGDRVLGVVALTDRLREGVTEGIAEMRRLGIKRVIVLTGDRRVAGEKVARSLGVDEVETDLLPEDKVMRIRQLRAQGARVAMVGDGINDAAALKEADVGIAVGNPDRVGLAMEVAEVVFLSDRWQDVARLISLAKRTRRVILGNIVFGIAFNIVGMTLAAIGVLSPIGAAAAQALPDVLVLFNSSRLLKG
ncbi:MAG: heavy metal translocating P-type ATPase [bacterium JZ-2024 1]